MGFGNRYEGEGTFAEAEAASERERQKRDARIRAMRSPPPALALTYEWAVAWTAEHLPDEAPVMVLGAAWMLSYADREVTPESVLERLEASGRSSRKRTERAA